MLFFLQGELTRPEGRRVPRGKEDSTTLFDGEWLDAQAADPILIHPREDIKTTGLLLSA